MDDHNQPSKKIGPESPLPLPKEFTNAETYVTSLLNFITTNHLLQTLCGGVHILDFFTRKPDLYTEILPEEWSQWFKSVEILDILDLLMRYDLSQFDLEKSNGNSIYEDHDEKSREWQGHLVPPQTLIAYIRDIRSHTLNRDFTPTPTPATTKPKLNPLICVGMNPKKVHEVSHFASYIDNLTTKIQFRNNNLHSRYGVERRKITHLIDFGAGQNYLGRALASHPYDRDIVAIESRPHVVEGARKMDVQSMLVERVVVRRNKKVWRAGLGDGGETRKVKRSGKGCRDGECTNGVDKGKQAVHREFDIPTQESSGDLETLTGDIDESTLKQPTAESGNKGYVSTGSGTVRYIEHRIQDGNLEDVIQQLEPSPSEYGTNGTTTVKSSPEPQEEQAEQSFQMVISLHSCGNLVHHGLRTLTLNPSVQAVALVGCCYNLMTESLPPPIHKQPSLQDDHPRLEPTGNACDTHGFPMSNRFLKYKRHAGHALPSTPNSKDDMATINESDEGIRLNITSRMLSLQAPQNWSPKDSASFFTRHFYRALLQLIFLEKGVLSPPPSANTIQPNTTNGRNTGTNTDEIGKSVIIIGTMSKKCYLNFPSYVRGAVAKISTAGAVAPSVVELVKEKLGDMSDEEIRGYEERFEGRKKELSIVWSLMAFSAGVIEALIVVDRWSWLEEQDCVGEAWVESVFDYGESPRNLVVVGLRKGDGEEGSGSGSGMREGG
ncbi:hypothetical protein EJ08DRAFT_644649 [Tothia fuscella]|uniref:Methyltransferase domain-containing protein n=1 Tax=Tothia fuscella TaxID=1048955 RepID=A0A9P4P5A0_9PEZI|nr:hypothetical protein EJ08DRAFT_644649 [Tothia fuscella]